MANYNRHRGSDNTNYGNRDEERDRYSRKDYNQNQYGSDYDDRQDYDQRRDYGNTSSGSYNSDNDNRRWRRYDEDKDDYNRRTSNYGNRNYGNSYGSSQQNRDYDQNRYGNTGNYGSSSYGGSSAYGDLGYGNAGYGNDYNRYRGYNQNTNEDYGTGSYGYGQGYGRRSDRDRDWDNRNRQGDRDWWDKTKDEVSSWFGDEDAERRRRMDRRLGAHRGRGPKGYTRSDERIREDINDRLSDDSFLDATEIDVTVSNGEVTLTGTVENRIDKRRAEDLAEDISGVKNVQNQLRVKQTTTTAANGLKNEYQG
jgi:osmotically-inducible protein OsmY